MPLDSALIDAALLARLSGDAALTALCPDGVYVDEAKQNAQRFVIVSLVEAFDEATFGLGRTIESSLYLVKAVMFGNSSLQAAQAAARIDVLLEDVPLTAAGYTGMALYREDRMRMTEVDEADPSLRWQHRGGRYRVEMSIGA